MGSPTPPGAGSWTASGTQQTASRCSPRSASGMRAILHSRSALARVTTRGISATATNATSTTVATAKSTATSCAHANASAVEATTRRIRAHGSTTTSNGVHGTWSAHALTCVSLATSAVLLQLARTSPSPSGKSCSAITLVTARFAGRQSASRRTTGSRSIAVVRMRSTTSCLRVAGATVASIARPKRSSARCCRRSARLMCSLRTG